MVRLPNVSSSRRSAWRMSCWSQAAQRGALAIGLLSMLSSHPGAATERLRVMAANLTSGNGQSYDPGEGIRIMQGMAPDIVLIQEFNYGDDSDDDLRVMVDAAFGPEFSFYREGNANIPNGIISRYPIVEFGEWDDKQVSDRDFAYARINIPGPVDLWAISLHLLTSSSGDRSSEAQALVKLIQQNIPSGDLVVLGGDFNTSSRTEACITALSNVVVTKGPYPADQKQNDNTNEGRSKPYDWLLADPELDAYKTPVLIGSSTFPNGLVIDSEVYTPLEEVAPIELGDSHAKNMQHMGVVRDFLLPVEDLDGDGITDVDGDCNDQNDTVGPGFPELPDGLDNDCDSIVDEGTILSDDDGDGFTEEQGDCDDTNLAMYPQGQEIEDGLDNDCNGTIDDQTDAFDDDLDGYSENQGDCDDRNPSLNPDVTEVLDGIDNNCDGQVDEGFATPTPSGDGPTGDGGSDAGGCGCTQQIGTRSRDALGAGQLVSGLLALSFLRRRRANPL